MMAERRHEETEAMQRLLTRVVPLIDESRALSYALIMALASTPHDEFSREEIDGLCQLAYELQSKLSKVAELFHGPDKASEA